MIRVRSFALVGGYDMGTRTDCHNNAIILYHTESYFRKTQTIQKVVGILFDMPKYHVMRI